MPNAGSTTYESRIVVPATATYFFSNLLSGLPPKSSFYWTQGLYLNYDVFGFIDNTYQMDTRETGSYQPPLYPNQYDDRHFYDAPRGPWDGGFFKAEAFLSQVDYTSRTLTIYEGARYGFNLSAVPVPEPSTLLLLTLTLPVVVIVTWVRRAVPMVTAETVDRREGTETERGRGRSTT